jgi:hypothetical protein
MGATAYERRGKAGGRDRCRQGKFGRGTIDCTDGVKSIAGDSNEYTKTFKVALTAQEKERTKETQSWIGAPLLYFLTMVKGDCTGLI